MAKRFENEPGRGRQLRIERGRAEAVEIEPGDEDRGGGHVGGEFRIDRAGGRGAARAAHDGGASGDQGGQTRVEHYKIMIAGNGGAGDQIGGDSRRGKVLTRGKREATASSGRPDSAGGCDRERAEVRGQGDRIGARLCGGRDSREGTAPWVKVAIRLRRHCR